MTLSEYLHTLNDYLGYAIMPDETTGRKSEPLILRGFLFAFVDPTAPEDCDVPDYVLLNQSDDFLRRVYNGTKALPYNDANSILNRLDCGYFYDGFLPTEPTKETLKNMKKAFKTFGETIDIDDYGYSLAHILEKILTEIVLSNQEGRINDPRTNELLQEVNMECPLSCNHKKIIKLIETQKDPVTNKMKLKSNFFVTKIFPDNLPSSLLIEFEKKQKKPPNTNDDSNKICLCEKCARSYITKPNINTFEQLLKIKNDLTRTKKIRDKTIGTNLEEQINDVLKKLCNISITDEMATLRMKPIEIKRKIYDENIDLKQKISEDIKDYYYIRDLFASLDEKGSIFNIIANEIKLFYQKICLVENDQYIIYYSIVDWILEQSKMDKIRYKIAGEKIVSFFVQDCEVFDEIS